MKYMKNSSKGKNRCEMKRKKIKNSIFATCLNDCLSELLDLASKTIILYSDGCDYQNCNSILFEWIDPSECS